MATKVMVSFPDDFLTEVDRIASEEQRSRSELLREAMRLYIQVRRQHAAPGNDPQVQKAVDVMDEMAKIHPGTGEDSTLLIREWRDRLYNAGNET